MCSVVLVSSSVERYSAVWRRQGYDVTKFVTAVFWNDLAVCTSEWELRHRPALFVIARTYCLVCLFFVSSFFCVSFHFTI